MLPSSAASRTFATRLPLLIVIALLIWILDYVGLLDPVQAALGLIAAAVVGTVRLAARLARHLAGASKPS